jgi:hypothetical protein
MSLKSMEGMSARAEINEHCGRDTRVDLSSSHQFEEEISSSSSEDRLFIPKMEFSVAAQRMLSATAGNAEPIQSLTE